LGDEGESAAPTFVALRSAGTPRGGKGGTSEEPSSRNTWGGEEGGAWGESLGGDVAVHTEGRGGHLGDSGMRDEREKEG